MPCGGIWTPEPGSHWLDHECWVCREKGCELFCDEWDTTLHVRCLGKFLDTDEGRCMLLHGHGIHVEEREDGKSWPGVELDIEVEIDEDGAPKGFPHHDHRRDE